MRKKDKAFFSEEKKQKTFVPFAVSVARSIRRSPAVVTRFTLTAVVSAACVTGALSAADLVATASSPGKVIAIAALTQTSMELDHVFVLVEPEGADLAYLRSLGLTETYRRRHPGQGTENICFCFDNIFLECLWVSSVGEVTSGPIARTGLYERSQWRTRGTSPFGFAWRGDASGRHGETATWPFRPPYLPAGMSIDVATDSDDFRQPMMFRSPGARPPAKWSADRRGVLQEPAGLGKVISVVFNWPERAPPAQCLLSLEASTILKLVPAIGDTTSVSLVIEHHSSREPLEICLPRPRLSIAS